MSNEIAEIYAAKTGKTVDEMRNLMLAETWLDSKQCIELGLADGLFDFRATAGKITDMKLLDRLTTPAQPEALAEIETLKSALADRESNIVELTDKLTLAEFALQDAATLKASLDEATAKLTRAEADAIDAVNQLAQAKSDHAAALEAAKASAAAQAVEIAASAGIAKPLEIIGGESASATTIEEIQAKLEAEKDPAKRTVLYRQFKAAIKAAK
jgi:hypothetical protein